MSLWMIGGGGGQPPFNRTFFNVSLGGILEHAGKEKGNHLTLYLIDGSQLDVRSIEELSELYLIVRATVHNDEDAEPHVHVLPYSSIHRLEVAFALDEESRRLGFRWTSSDRSRIARKALPRATMQPISNEEPRADENLPEVRKDA